MGTVTVHHGKQYLLIVVCRTGLFDNVDARVLPMRKGKSLVRFVFKEKMWPEMQSFKVTCICQLQLQTESCGVPMSSFPTQCSVCMLGLNVLLLLLLLPVEACGK